MKKHAGNNTINGMKEAVKQRTILEEVIAQVFIYCKNTMPVWDTNQLKGHIGSALHGVFVSTGRAKTAVTTERDKFKLSAVRATIHGAAKRRITTVDHFINIFHLSISGMKRIFDFFIIVGKDFLQYIHKTIMHEKREKENPLIPLMIEGAGGS